MFMYISNCLISHLSEYICTAILNLTIFCTFLYIRVKICKAIIIQVHFFIHLIKLFSFYPLLTGNRQNFLMFIYYITTLFTVYISKSLYIFFYNCILRSIARNPIFCLTRHFLISTCIKAPTLKTKMMYHRRVQVVVTSPTAPSGDRSGVVSEGWTLDMAPAGFVGQCPLVSKPVWGKPTCVFSTYQRIDQNKVRPTFLNDLF